MARNWEEFLVEKVLLLAAISSIIIILLIIGFVIQQGLPAMEQVGPLNFIFGMDWSPSYDIYGVFPMIVGSLGMMALARYPLCYLRFFRFNSIGSLHEDTLWRQWFQYVNRLHHPDGDGVTHHPEYI